MKWFFQAQEKEASKEADVQRRTYVEENRLKRCIATSVLRMRLLH